ncbi:MAG: hypothetical protein RLZ67_272 [Actinomycetota bacterium]
MRCGQAHLRRKWVGTTVLGVNVVEQSPGVGVMWSDALRARLRPWSGDPDCGFLVMTTTESEGPHPSEIQQWLTTAKQWGYRRLRTSALPPTLTAPLRDAGFTEVQQLTVLSVAHPDAPSFHVPRDVAPRPLRSVRRQRPSQKMLDVLHIDALSFPSPWNMSWVDLNDAVNATQQSRLLVSQNKKVIDGFVLVGATHNTGFIQRLAVHPTARRTGVASRLVAASLEWSYRRGCSTTVVNTEITNHSALGLYTSLGFQQMPDGLSVMEREL